MSVIVAKSTVRYGEGGGTPPNLEVSCFPAVTLQRSVPISGTVTIDSLLTSRFRGAQWLVVVSNVAGTRVRSYQLNGVHRNGSNPAFVQYGILGNAIAHVPNVTTTGGFLNLTIANTDSEELLIYATRMSIPTAMDVPNTVDVVEIGSACTLVRSGTTVTLDMLTPTDVIAATWMISATNATGARTATQVFAQLVNGVTATEYGHLGDMELTYDLVVNEIPGMGVELAMTSTSFNDYKVDLTRVPVRIDNVIPYCGTSSGLSLWLPEPVTISAGATVVVDQPDVPIHSSVHWLFSANQSTASMMCQVNATLPTLCTSETVQWGIVGDFIDLTLTTAVSAGKLVFSVTNNESTPVTINLLRVPTVS